MPPSPSNNIAFFLALSLAALGQTSLALGASFLWLCFGCLAYAAGVWALSRSYSAPSSSPALPQRWELLGFFLILGLAFFFRIYRIDSLPPGMHSDQGLTGLCALRILHEGWRPFGEVFDYEVPEILLFYQLAGWFGAVGSSYFTFHLFFILLSLASFPLIYWTFRQWAGPRTALLSLFILAVMRWSWTMTRNGYPSTQVPFYLFSALAFWTYALRNGKRWAFYVSALCVGVGFYTYQAFKIVPFLMALYALDEWLHQKKRDPKPFLLYFLLVLAVITPLLTVMFDKGRIGYRENILFIGNEIIQEKSLAPLWEVWTGTALMFNRSGDLNPRHNIPGQRMLDDVTGVLFILGIGLAWRRRRDPGAFYPLVGFVVMAVTNLLTNQPAQANRLFSLTPFVAFFAGSALESLFQNTLVFFRKPNIPRLVLANTLALMTALNAYTYFVTQARDKDCQGAFGIEQNFIGRNIEWYTSRTKDLFYVSPSFYGNHTVAFLAYPAKDRIKKLDLQDWSSQKEPAGLSAQIFVEGEKRATMEFLALLHPGLQWKIDQDSLGHSWVYQGVVPPGTGAPWSRGLAGSYFYGTVCKVAGAIERKDPLLNFDSKFDFPFTQGPPFGVRWTGDLEIPNSGPYRFQVLTTDSAQLYLDGKIVELEKPLSMKKGPHTLRLDLSKEDGDHLALHLVWKKPGEDRWEVVPAETFGKIQQK